MVKSQKDPITGDYLVDFGVSNDETGEWKKFRTDMTEYDAIYEIKANAPINTEAHSNVQTQLRAGKIRFLIDERQAKAALLATKVGQKMRPEERADKLLPYTLTSVLREEMLNLKEETEGVNIILKQATKGIPKDKFSAFEYGLYWIKLEEDSKRKRGGKKFSQYMFMN